MDTNINIIFSNQASGGTESDPECPGVTPNPEAPEQNKTGGKESNKGLTVAKAMALSVARQSISNVTSRVGATTRSNVKQQRVNSATKIAGYGIGIGTAIATGNYGALAIMGISAVTNAVTEGIDYERNRSIEMTALSINRQRAGLDRSR